MLKITSDLVFNYFSFFIVALEEKPRMKNIGFKEQDHGYPIQSWSKKAIRVSLRIRRATIPLGFLSLSDIQVQIIQGKTFL